MNDCTDIDKMNIIKFDQYKVDLWEKVRQPLSATIELTPRCNFNCVHCYMQNCHQKPEMSYEELIHIIDVCYEKGVLFLTFTGGEVFTRNDFVDIYLYAKKKGFVVGFFTNAYRIKDEYIEVFKEYPPLLIDISLYGANNETYFKVTGVKGAFDIVVDNCNKLINAGLRIALKSPIITYTLMEISCMRELAHSMKVDFRFSFDISPTLENDRGPEQYEVSVKDMFKYEIQDPIRIKEGKKAATIENGYAQDFIDGIPTPLFLCKVGKNEFFIDYEGNMCPCASYRTKGEKLTNNFDEIWEKFATLQKVKASLNNKCAKCDCRYFCKVCPAEMESITGNPEAIPESLCKFSKIRKSYFKDLLSADEAITKMEHE